MQKRWLINQPEHERVLQLQQELKIHPVLCRMLVSRGIHTFDEAKLFFRPQLEYLHDPFLMQDMRKAVERIQTAIRNEEKILVYGDYDVDGTTSVALMYLFLSEFYNRVDYYVPHRYREGYGISKQGIDYAHENGCKLIIALDCGIKAVEKVNYANELGIDFIICDHHLPGDELPLAHAVLDPKRNDCNYPYKELSGCGIGFKLIQAFAQHNDIPFEVVEKYLDLVAVSIASDIVPITGENRVLAYYGVKRINENPRKGIKSLIETGKLKKALTISDIVFVLGPRINAAGRMDDARNAVKLLISDTHELATENAELLNQNNTERKQVDKDITAEALEMINESTELQKKKTTVLAQPHWHKGVIGIVASRLIETWYRPTIVFTESNGMMTGSARSVKGFNIHDAIKECSDLLEQFGGHMFAAGLSLKKENFEIFQQHFEEVVSATITEGSLTPEVVIDAELNFTDINERFFNIINQFAPFGPGNMKPVFVSHNVRDRGYSRIVGDDHLKLELTQDEGRYCKGIAFGMGDLAGKIFHTGVEKRFDICYTLEENEWQGIKNIELNVKDIKLPDVSLIPSLQTMESVTESLNMKSDGNI
ncbi:MAG: single-stranded-DNA-specific exonuclease RecJ [Chitinophagales bacterium]|nr:single-stranded-DNA-specific exonuclease RecJ [Chitinophagales bacterium]